MGSLRSKEGEDRYQKAIVDGALDNGCVLCKKEPIKLFQFWKTIKNDFPYDVIAEKHDMIVPLRHATEDELSKEELEELREIKRGYINVEYEWMLEATHHKKSIPEHFHMHAVTVKDWE